MNKVYIVEAHFDDPSSSWWSTIGLFTDEQVAKEYSEKWNLFFTENEKIFDIPKNFQSQCYNSYDGQSYTSWFESDEYYELISDFKDIRYFKEITITEFDLNTEIFIDCVRSINSDRMLNLMNQWNRNYKINELIK